VDMRRRHGLRAALIITVKLLMALAICAAF
jgi:hypothetical protein